ncbi:hypothetical protein AB0A94_17430 [Streptomyces sp. NPDC044984]|uniref:hypothetical protein n=1 Tax=Streptomyces sp. NPDC044984 TaxID=3154335 RepID=UPI00340EBAF4
MPQPVLALGCAAATAAGCVWYLPALADLRAGADRPLSRRTAAIACLTGWGTLATVAPVLLLAAAWWVPAVVAAAGGTAAAVLWTGTAVRRAGERREAARQWARLPYEPPPTARHPRGTVAALVVAGPVAAVTAVVAPVVVVTVPALVVGLLLMIAVRHTRMVRRTAASRGRPPG